jgi:hypothetical protein
MTSTFRHWLAALTSASALTLVACGGGGGSDDSGSSSVVAPTAVVTASSDSVQVGEELTLDASASSTPNDGTLSYEWTIESAPADSSATLNEASSAQASFTPDLPGNYVFKLTVHDGKASSSTTVTVSTTTTVPIAVINPRSQNVKTGTTVTLDGSGSVAPTGSSSSELSYQWTLVSQPEVDSSKLSDSSSASTTLQPIAAGVYTIQLVVRHGEQSSKAAEATVTVNKTNSAPVIAYTLENTTLNENQELSVARGTTVILNGEASYDPDGDTLTYRWAFRPYPANDSKPKGSSAEISESKTAKASFIPDVVGTYKIDYIIHDNKTPVSETITLKVTKPEGVANTPPVAAIAQSNTKDYQETESGGSIDRAASQSYDIDGDTLTYKWSYWASDNPEVILGTSEGEHFGLTKGTLADGEYIFNLVVNDGEYDSTAAQQTTVMKIGANTNSPIVSSSSADLERVMVGTTIEFTGEVTDYQDDRYTYEWTLLDRPNNSTSVLQNTNQQVASIVADQPGYYVVQLKSTDEHGLSSIPNNEYANSKVFAKASNDPPIIISLTNSNGGTDPRQPLCQEEADKDEYGIYLTAEFYDPENDDPIYLHFSLPKQPEGSVVEDYSVKSVYNSGSNSQIRSQDQPFTIYKTGVYTATVTASDLIDTSETKETTLYYVEKDEYPTLKLVRHKVDSNSVQRTFPYKRTSQWSRSSFYERDNKTSESMYEFELTAYDKDYTITDLIVESTDVDRPASFDGIANGTVIKAGETLSFNTLNRWPGSRHYFRIDGEEWTFEEIRP